MANLSHVYTLTGFTDAKACVVVGDYLFVADNDVGIVRLRLFKDDYADGKVLALAGIWGIESWENSILVVNGTTLEFYTHDLVKQGELALTSGYVYRGMQRIGNKLYISSYTGGQGVTIVDLITRTYTHHSLSDTLEDVSVSPSGELVATGTYGTNSIIYDASFNVVSTITLTGQFSRAVRFGSNDVLYVGIYAIATGENTLAAYSPVTGTLLDSITTIDGSGIYVIYGIHFYDKALFISSGSRIYIVEQYSAANATTADSDRDLLDGGVDLVIDQEDITVDSTTETKRIVPVSSPASKYIVRRAS